MSVEEIKMAIHALNPDERRDLIGSLVPRTVRPTAGHRERIRAIIEDNDAGDKWVPWDDLKAEMSHRELQ